jgi:rhodanese-related sulfurtransferase
VNEIRPAAHGSLEVCTAAGQVVPADLVVLGIGVRPENWLAKNAGLTIGALGGIRVDDQMRTSDPDIFAVGDAVEIKDTNTGQWSLVALAGPANRQGRIAADVIAGRAARFRGSQGTAIIGLFGGAAAWTGLSEKTLQRSGETDYEKIYLYPNSHAGYYPGAQYLAMKIIFRKSDGRLLGAQAVGLDGVDKRIDAFAMAIQLGATVYDLEESELCYAPQFGSAKSPVNFAGMVAADVLGGDMPISHWNSLEAGLLLDVRHPAELAVEQAPGAVNIPLDQLRARLGELPRDREIHVICRSGQRAYYATRILLHHGFAARTIAGGMLSQNQPVITAGPMTSSRMGEPTQRWLGNQDEEQRSTVCSPEASRISRKEQAMSTERVSTKVPLNWKEVWFTNCPMVSANNVDQELGWCREEFKKIGVEYAYFRHAPENNWYPHYVHNLDNLIRFGGLYPPIHVHADIRRTRLLGQPGSTKAAVWRCAPVTRFSG